MNELYHFQTYYSKQRSTSRDSKPFSVKDPSIKKQFFDQKKFQFQQHALSLKKSFPQISKSPSSKHIINSANNVQVSPKVVKKLCQILTTQETTLEKFKEWTERQKSTVIQRINQISIQFENLSSQVINFMNKSKASITQSLDKLYIQMLQTYKQIKNMTKSLYSKRRNGKQNQMYLKRMEKKDIANYAERENYEIICQLIGQKELHRQYYNVKCFYDENQEQFKRLSQKISTISDLSENQLFQNLNIELSLKQFQNYLYSSLKQVKNKLIWDKSPTLFEIK